jgi:protein-S-isoprenylcysteine O-methyltransferase Ste14
MGKASLVLIVLSHYLLILYAHVRYGRPKKEREGTYRKVTAILLKDWLLTPIIIASAIVYVFTGNEPIWRNVSVAVSGKAKIIGAVLIIVSMLLKFYAYKTLGRNWSPKLNIYPDHELVRVGPYKYLRHPVYVSYSLTFMGLALILGNFLCSIFGFIYQVLNLIRAKHEEGGACLRNSAKNIGSILPIPTCIVRWLS